MRRICLSTVDIRMKNISEKKNGVDWQRVSDRQRKMPDNREHMDEDGWADAKSSPWATRSLIPSSSDAKSNLSCPSTSLEQGGLTKKAAISVKYKSELKKTTIDQRQITEGLGKLTEGSATEDRDEADGSTLSLNPGADAKSSPQLKRREVEPELPTSDAKSNLSCPQVLMRGRWAHRSS
jgi:hypothetical protein